MSTKKPLPDRLAPLVDVLYAALHHPIDPSTLDAALPVPVSLSIQPPPDFPARQHAFVQAVYEDYCPLLLRFFKRKGATPATAEDLASETILGFIEDYPASHAYLNFQAWLFALARTRWSHHVRHASSEQKYQLKVLPHFQVLAALEAHTSSPEDVLIKKEQAEFKKNLYDRFRTYLSTIPPEARSILTSFYLEGKSYHQLAHELDLTLYTVKSRLYRSRRKYLLPFFIEARRAADAGDNSQNLPKPQTL